MKKLLLILSMMFIATSIFGQWGNWYQYNDINITDYSKFTKEQLNFSLNKAESNIQTGKILTYIGCGVTVIGIIVYASGLSGLENSNSYSSIDSNFNKGMAGIYVALGGITLAGIGIPVWIINNNKKDQIEVALIKFKPQTKNIIGISIKFNL